MDSEFGKLKIQNLKGSLESGENGGKLDSKEKCFGSERESFDDINNYKLHFFERMRNLEMICEHEHEKMLLKLELMKMRTENNGEGSTNKKTRANAVNLCLDLGKDSSEFIRIIRSSDFEVDEYIDVDDLEFNDKIIKKVANKIMKSGEEILKRDTEEDEIVLAWKLYHDRYGHDFMEVHLTKPFFNVTKIDFVDGSREKYQSDLREIDFLQPGYFKIMNDLEWKNRLDSKLPSYNRETSMLLEHLQTLFNKYFDVPSISQSKTMIRLNSFDKGILYSVVNNFETFNDLITAECDRLELKSIRTAIMDYDGKEKKREWLSENLEKFSKWQIDLLQIILQIVKHGDYKTVIEENGNLSLFHRTNEMNGKILHLKFREEPISKMCDGYRELLSASLINEEEVDSYLNASSQNLSEWTKNNVEDLWVAPKVYWYVPTEQDLLPGFEFVNERYPIVLSNEKPSENAQQVYWKCPKDTDQMMHIYDAYIDQQEVP